jgi:AcrR family transcriptional regulator
MRAQNSPTSHSSSAAHAGGREFSLQSPEAVAPPKSSSDRSALIAAAAQLFSRYGFKQTTLREIARTAGRPLSAVRREFGGKSGLIESVLGTGGPSARPRLLRGSDNSLQQDICHLIEWEASRMGGHKELIDSLLPDDPDEPERTRIAGNLSFSSADVIGERLRRHRNLTAAERQFLLYAIQSVGLALGFVRPKVAAPATIRSRVRKLSGILAESIERGEPQPNRFRFLPPSLLPV